MIRRILAGLRVFYKGHAVLYSSIELSLFLGLYFFYVWGTSIWFWGIYRLNIHAPDTLERIFFFVWQIRPHLIAPLVILGLSLLALTLAVRKDPLKELGIRLDNLKSSGRECFVAFLISTGLILTVFFIHLKNSSPYSPPHYYWLSLYPLWGIAQQFWLQSIMFVRFMQILKIKYLAIIVAAVIFSLLHAPNLPLMLITFIAGLCCCILFFRQRNIFTIGIFHAVMAAMAYVLLVPGVLDSFAVGPIPWQWEHNTEFIARIRYEGTAIEAKPTDVIIIPIEIENKGSTRWDSHENQHPVHLSYHLLNAEGDMIAFDNRRTSFTPSIEPHELRNVDLTVTVPPDLGHYLLEIDVVQERVTWFKDKGSLTLQIPLKVSMMKNQSRHPFLK